ncbi:oxidoreductase [Pseudovibrio denitrificans]|uniref:oxidoreductase n=1 Tax=Pseudovibrio denitrificans TaxID=258256 RepID=UPI0039BF4EFE
MSSKAKVALVTGASSGMGKEIARNLMKDGLVVYSAARSVEKMEDLAASGAHVLQMDVTKEEDLIAVVEKIKQVHGTVDVLVNNAGFGCYGSVEETSMEDVRYQFDVNFFGVARLTQLVLPLMRAQKSGKIINITSTGGKMYTPLGAWYHASKHAVEGWSDSLRLEAALHGIDVVVVEPGIILTEFGNVMLKPMMERSGSGPYGKLAHNIENASRAAYEKKTGSPASLIADVVSQAVRAARPKTRYAAGRYAKLMIFVRTYLGDRLFDRMVMSTLK